jgi:prepilin-type N-terminal cleavage/methylation domain-containing protein
MERAFGNRRGFTLIEIIAVLTVLGILAAVAVPRYQDMLEEAKRSAAKGAVAAGMSALTMGYSIYLLNSAYAKTPAQVCSEVALDGGPAASFNVVCTGDDWSINSSMITGTYDDKSFSAVWPRP